MKTTKTLFYMLSLCALVCFSSCEGTDKPGTGGGGGETPDPDPKPVLTPDEHKAKIENIGKEFVAKFDASENEVIAKEIYKLEGFITGSNLGDLLDLGSSEDIAPLPPMVAKTAPLVILQNTLNTLSSVITKNDIQSLASRASTIEEFGLSDYEGIYTYNGTEWVKTEASNKIELKYDNDKSSFTINISDIRYYTNVDDYKIEIPGKTIVSLTANGTELVSSTTTIKLSTDQKTVDATVDIATNTNYKWIVKVSAKGDRSTLHYNMLIKDEGVMSATAEITGANMTDPDFVEGNEDNLDKVFHNGVLTYGILDMKLHGTADIKAIVSALNKLDSYEIGNNPSINEANSKKYAEQESQIVTDYANIEMSYLNGGEKIADVILQPTWETTYSYIYDENDPYAGEVEWKEWYSSPVLVFASDDSKIAIEDFFSESRFSSFIGAVEDLANEFTKMLDLEPVEL